MDGIDWLMVSLSFVFCLSRCRIVDNLPAATPKMLQDANGKTTIVYESGYPLGIQGEVDEVR